MGASFRHREIGRFYAALVTCVQNSCKDFGRKELRHDMRAAGSIDSTFDPDGEAGPFDGALAAYDQHLREQVGDALDEEHSRVEAEQLVAWGISQIANDNYREVLEMTWTSQAFGRRDRRPARHLDGECLRPPQSRRQRTGEDPP